MIETHVSPEERLTVHRVTGRVRSDDLASWAVEFVRNPQTPLALWDLTGADLSPLTVDQLRRIFARLRPHADNREGGKAALLFGSPVGFGLGRVCEALSESHEFPYRIRSFWERKAALAWLMSEEEDSLPGQPEDGVA